MVLQTAALSPFPQPLFYSSAVSAAAKDSSAKAQSSVLSCTDNNNSGNLFRFMGLYSKSKGARKRIGVSISSPPTARTSLSLFTRINEVALSLGFLFSSCRISSLQKTIGCTILTAKVTRFPNAKCSHNQRGQPKTNFRDEMSRTIVKKDGKNRHHLWKKRDPARSGEKALNLVRIVSELPNEKEAVYGALDKWTAWETEFPLLAVAKALKILRKRSQWMRVIQVAKWMLSKGQGTTMVTYDTLLLAFDMNNRIDEAESLWNMILHTHTRSISKRLFSRMISLYDHHNMPDEIIEVFADMEELGVRPDEDTTRRVTHAFKILGQEDKQNLVVKKYLRRWKYIHFKGERIRVRRDI